MRRIRPSLLLFALVLIIGPFALPATAAAPVQGTVVAIDYYTVRVVVSGKLPTWIKKGRSLRFMEVRSLVVGISADTVSIGSSNAGGTTLGAVVALKKWKPGPNGC